MVDTRRSACRFRYRPTTLTGLLLVFLGSIAAAANAQPDTPPEGVEAPPQPDEAVVPTDPAPPVQSVETNEPRPTPPPIPASTPPAQPSNATATSAPATMHSSATNTSAEKPGIQVGGLRFDELKMGGYFQPAFVVQGNTEFNPDDEDGFEFRNARLTGEGHLPINELFASSFVFNFDVATGVFLVRDLYGSLHVAKDLVSLDVGQMKAPFLLTEMVSEAKLQFPTQALGPKRLGYGRDRGIRARGKLRPGGFYIGWYGAMQNGEGATVTSNSDSEFLYSGRLEVGPLGEVPLDEPDLDDSDFGFVLGGATGYTDSTARKDLGIEDVGAEELRVEGDVRLRFRGLTLRAEYAQSRMNRKDSGVKFDRYGFYAQAGYVLPLGFKTKFELVGRVEQVDLNDAENGVIAVGGADANLGDPESLSGGTAGFSYAVPDNSEVRKIELGANAYIVDHRLKIQASYVLTDYQEGPKTEGGGNPIVGDLVQVQLQFGWL